MSEILLKQLYHQNAKSMIQFDYMINIIDDCISIGWGLPKPCFTVGKKIYWSIGFYEENAFSTLMDSTVNQSLGRASVGPNLLDNKTMFAYIKRFLVYLSQGHQNW